MSYTLNTLYSFKITNCLFRKNETGLVKKKTTSLVNKIEEGKKKGKDLFYMELQDGSNAVL